MKRTTNLRRQNRGFTLIELCTAAGICATLVSQAVPAFTQMRQHQALRAQAEALATDLRQARSEAMRANESVFFRISGKGANACYVLHIGTRNDCDCSGGQASCRSADSHVVKAVWLPAGLPASLSSNAETLEFQQRQGLVTQTGSIELKLTSGTAIRQVVAITGRVRSCTSSGTLAGMPRCA